MSAIRIFLDTPIPREAFVKNIIGKAQVLMPAVMSVDAKVHSVKKFYFLEYFYVLLKSVQNYSSEQKIFEQFLTLKQNYQLGLSKYKRLTGDDPASPKKMGKYKYTFYQVLAEAEEYHLVEKRSFEIVLTDLGKQALNEFEKKGSVEFNQFLFKLMERKNSAFRYILDVCYEANPEKSGLLIFPIYSANRLGIERSSIKTSGNLRSYFHKLKIQLEKDILKHLNQNKNLDEKNNELVEQLENADLLSKDSSIFDPQKYDVILKRVRDFWLKFFLQDLYNYKFSLNSFDIWAYRGKEIGVLHITEFYPDPNFSGRIVYPLSVIKESVKSRNFKELFSYSDHRHLYIHQPSWDDEENREEFAKALHQAYLDVRHVARSYFVNLASVRERVCYIMKIPEYLFDQFLERAYYERLKIRISLEVDKLPEETDAIYLKRTPVMVDGKYRNIIAIDLA